MIYYLPDVLERMTEDGAVLFEGFDDCIAGIASRSGCMDVVAYDFDKLMDKLMHEQGMTRNEALEYLEFNLLEAWLGEGTPIIIEGYRGRDDD
jgi:hypothetical protein